MAYLCPLQLGTLRKSSGESTWLARLLYYALEEIGVLTGLGYYTVDDRNPALL